MSRGNLPGARDTARGPQRLPDPLAVNLRSAGIFHETCDGALVRSELFQIVTADGVVGEIVARIDAPMTFARAHGHVGYRILPAFRGQGFASAALVKLREMVRAPGRTLLVTCDASNYASRKTLLNAGATLVVKDSGKNVDGDRLLFALDCQA